MLLEETSVSLKPYANHVYRSLKYECTEWVPQTGDYDVYWFLLTGQGRCAVTRAVYGGDIGTFWKKYCIVKSPGDGHCFIHSIVTGIKSMHPSICHIQATDHGVLEALKAETICNAQTYIPISKGVSFESLMRGMNAYVYHKQYDSLFGDTVPNIISNALEINIMIIYKTDNMFRVQEISPINQSSPRRYIMVYKVGKHYDGVTHLQNKESYCSEMTSVSQWEYLLHSACNDIDNHVTADDMHGLGNLSSCDSAIYKSVEINSDIPRKSNDPSNRSLVNIISWNVNGLTQDKLNKDILGSLFKDYDIILLSETWASDQDDYTLEGFKYHNYPRNYKHHAAKRESGGLGVFIRNEIQHGVSMWTHTGDVIAWLILKKSFFGFESEIYLANIYIVPEGSTYIRYD